MSRTPKPLAIIILFAAWICFIPSLAQAQMSPEDFLNARLVDDFTSDGSSRANYVHYSDGKGNIVGDCDCSMAREIFVPWGDPVVFVSGWRILETRMEKTGKALISVRFTVLARTEGETSVYRDKSGEIIRTYRKIIPLAAPEEETVSYRLWKIRGEWKLVDPPMPRISISAPVEGMQSQIEDEEDVLARDPSRDDLRDALMSSKEQLRVLEKLQQR